MMGSGRLDRRALLIGGAAMAVTKKAAARRPPTADRSLVRLPQGRIQGRRADGVVAFKAIPYAASPVGPGRFRPPSPALAWPGIRDGTEWAPAPIQSEPGFGMSPNDALGTPNRSEDCLYLNVFAPDTPGPHPVYVWVHGGGNESGAASQVPFDTGSFATAGIVCVTVGYRIGLLGFLELGGVLGPAWRGSGNNGLRDIVSALRWVRHNIAAFGGDADRVTLGGESAGAKNVVSLMAAPSAHGLCQRAIVESGGETIHDFGHATALGLEAGSWMAKRGLPADALRTLSPADILALQAHLRAGFGRPFPFRAVVGGDFLPRAPLAAEHSGATGDVALLIGTNRDESIVFLDRKQIGRPLAQSELSNIDLSAGAPVFERYRARYPDLSPIEVRVRFLTAEEYWRPSIDLAIARAAQGRATYLYRFDHKAQSGPFKGWTSHVAELGYAWDRLDTTTGHVFGQLPSTANDALAKEVHRRWVAFITDGVPDIRGMPAWPALSRSGLQAQIGDGPTRIMPYDANELEMWKAA